jgi:hypothetical protein
VISTSFPCSPLAAHWLQRHAASHAPASSFNTLRFTMHSTCVARLSSLHSLILLPPMQRTCFTQLPSYYSPGSSFDHATYSLVSLLGAALLHTNTCRLPAHEYLCHILLPTHAPCIQAIASALETLHQRLIQVIPFNLINCIR